MVRSLFSVLVLMASASVVQAAPQDYWPKSVQYFIDDSVSSRDLRVADRLMRATEYSVYDVTYATKRLEEFSKAVPEHIYKQGEEVTEDYIKKHIAPALMASAPNIAESKIGLSLAKIYGVERLPAVVIDGSYLTYGMSVGDSIKEFQWRKHREAQ